MSSAPPAPAAPVEAAPFIASRAEVGGTTYRPGGVFGPLDSINGVPIAQLCAGCKIAVLNWKPGGNAVTLCENCSAKVIAIRINFGQVAIAVERPATPVGALPTVEHPAPWRWEPAKYPQPDEFGRPQTLALYDGNGEEIIGTDGDDWSWVDVSSPRVRALTEAAPEMEALLRDMRDHFEYGAMAREHGAPDAWPDLAAQLRALLARIDAAAKR